MLRTVLRQNQHDKSRHEAAAHDSFDCRAGGRGWRKARHRGTFTSSVPTTPGDSWARRAEKKSANLRALKHFDVHRSEVAQHSVETDHRLLTSADAKCWLPIKLNTVLASVGKFDFAFFICVFLVSIALTCVFAVSVCVWCCASMFCDFLYCRC